MLTLNKWLAERKLSERDAAVILGVHRNTLRRYRKKQTPTPLVLRLALAAVAMGLPPADED